MDYIVNLTQKDQDEISQKTWCTKNGHLRIEKKNQKK